MSVSPWDKQCGGWEPQIWARSSFVFGYHLKSSSPDAELISMLPMTPV
jgi:hypothetical protein